MSSSNLEMKWMKFGKNLRNVGGLLILIIIPFIAFVALIIQLILIIVLINDFNEIIREQKSPYLEEFRSRYLAASIIKFIGAIALNVACVMIAAAYIFDFSTPIFPETPFGPFVMFIPIIILLIIGFVLMIVGSAVEMGAWDNLKMFIEQNREMFPKMGVDAIDGVEKLRSGALLWVLGFLIVPIAIGWIFQLIGYFTLGKIAEWEPVISKQPDLVPEPQPAYISAPTPVAAPAPVFVQEVADLIKFCPLCGAKLNMSGKYCGECGTQVRD